MLKYRLAEKEDNVALAALIRGVFDEFGLPQEGTVYNEPTTDNLYSLFEHDKAELWVAERDNIVVGCCGIYPTDGLPSDCAELVKYYLLPEERGKGVGINLFKRSMDSAKRLGYIRVYIESFPEFTKAITLYKQFGFIPLDEPFGNCGHTPCSIWMIKSIE